jgi:hypothetical protein
MVSFFVLLIICGAVSGCLFSWPMLWLISAALVVITTFYAYSFGGWDAFSVVMLCVFSVLAFQISAVLGGFLAEITRVRLKAINPGSRRFDRRGG